MPVKGKKDKKKNIIKKYFFSQNFSLNSKNPVLHKITEHLIEEASTEEEELLGLEASSENSTEQPDPELIRVLDRLVLYLRIVHSVDYYNHCEYPYEDEMPNRCGIMHARSGPPANKVIDNDTCKFKY